MQVLKLGKATASLAHLSNTAQVVRHTLVHRVGQWLEVAALQEGLEGPVKHGRCAEYQEGQGRSWQGQVEGWRQECIVPCHLEQRKFRPHKRANLGLSQAHTLALHSRLHASCPASILFNQ